MEPSPHLFPGVILVQKDVVSLRVGGKKGHHSPGSDPFLGQNRFQKGLGVSIQLLGLGSYHWILQNPGEPPPQLPGMEKGRPIDIVRQLRQRKILVNLDSQELRFFRVFRPVKTGGIFPGFRDGQQLLGGAPAFEILARFFLVGPDLGHELLPFLR